MQWILLGVIVIALLVLTRYHPKTGFGMLLGLAIIAGAIILFTDNSGIANRSKIAIDDIVVQNPVVTANYGGGYKINARLANKNTTSTLKELTLSFTLRDCENDSLENCTVIGQRERIINITIPPQQARDIEQFIALDSATPTSIPSWNIRVTRTRN